MGTGMGGEDVVHWVIIICAIMEQRVPNKSVQKSTGTRELCGSRGIGR